MYIYIYTDIYIYIYRCAVHQHGSPATNCNQLKNTATHCNTLQHPATHDMLLRIELTAKYSAGIDVLCNNAGVMASADQPTGDGYDIQVL